MSFPQTEHEREMGRKEAIETCKMLTGKWFTTDKPLPDGWYWWRKSKTEYPYPVFVEEKILIMDDDEKKWEWFYSGEFYKIVVPK